jgi:hypothetical protein
MTAGARYEKREVNHDGHVEETKRTGLFGNLNAKPMKGMTFTADYQFGSYEDPYTDISPSDFHRARFTARCKMKKLNVSGSFVYQLTENNVDDGWKTERSQVNVRAGYYDKKFKLSLGYGLIFSSHEGERNFVFYGSPSTWDILFEGRANLYDAYVKFLLHKNWTLSGYANYYKNDGAWKVERLILKPYLQLQMDGGFVGQLGYRYVDFKENMRGLNNYTASIFEISFGYRW